MSKIFLSIALCVIVLFTACASGHEMKKDEVSNHTSVPTRSSAEDIRRALDVKLAELKLLFPSLQGTHVDEAGGVAVLTVYAKAEDDSYVLAKRDEAEKLLHVPVRIHLIRSELRQND